MREVRGAGLLLLVRALMHSEVHGDEDSHSRYDMICAPWGWEDGTSRADCTIGTRERPVTCGSPDPNPAGIERSAVFARPNPALRTQKYWVQDPGI